MRVVAMVTVENNDEQVMNYSVQEIFIQLN